MNALNNFDKTDREYSLAPMQASGHDAFKVENLAIFKSYLLRHLWWKLASDHWFLN